MIYASGSGQDDARCFVMSLDEFGEISALHVLDVGGGAENGAAERSALVGGLVKKVEHDLLRVGLYLLF